MALSPALCCSDARPLRSQASSIHSSFSIWFPITDQKSSPSSFPIPASASANLSPRSPLLANPRGSANPQPAGAESSVPPPPSPPPPAASSPPRGSNAGPIRCVANAPTRPTVLSSVRIDGEVVPWNRIERALLPTGRSSPGTGSAHICEGGEVFDRIPAAAVVEREKVQSLFRRLSSHPVGIRVHGVIIKGDAKTLEELVEAEVADLVHVVPTVQDLLHATSIASARLRRLDVFDASTSRSTPTRPSCPAPPTSARAARHQQHRHRGVEAANPVTGSSGVYSKPEGSLWVVVVDVEVGVAEAGGTELYYSLLWKPLDCKFPTM